MALWNEYLVKKILFDNHPSLDDTRCLNRLQARQPCSSCVEICPEQVFSLPEPGSPQADWNACSDCGLCVSVCPARAIAPARLQAEKLYAAAARLGEGGTIVFTCRAGARADLTVEYPGALPWELLSLLALQGHVTILTQDCVQCAKSGCLTSLRENLRQAEFFLGEAFFRDRICVTQDPAETSARTYTRREAISLFMKRTGRTAAALLPMPQDTVPDGTLWRQLLVSLARGQKGRPSERPAPALRWSLPSFTEKCTACGLCTRMCPAGALLRAPGPDGSERFYMALLPHKCTACGLCSRVCPEGGILAPSRPGPARPGPADTSPGCPEGGIPAPSSPGPADTPAGPAWSPSGTALDDPARPLLFAVAAVPCIRCKEPVPVGSGSSICARCRGELRC